MQYDGVFVYFGNKKISEKTAIIAAMNACSFFSYFIKYELKEIFEIEGIEDINTRIGIDFGNNEQVQWVIFGGGDCSELTTNSLHTSLAPKMQAYAPANGIMIGQNVKDNLGILKEFCDLLRNKEGSVDEDSRYIYRDQNKNFYYSQYEFQWIKYLKSFPFVKAGNNNQLQIIYNPQLNNLEQDRLSRLLQTEKDFANGSFYINPSGKLNKQAEGEKIQPNKFYGI
jgi:hypothetical protein